MKDKIREEEEILHLNKEDLPPTLVTVLDLERQEGLEQGFKARFEKGIKQNNHWFD
ncbi:hypothetical protein ACQKOF_09335 [Lysinibacillus sp. NPDC093190]|uniref:hypothetical protein n=1 Tax=Lysinibacillus sp. NPDC093190 TaxID=3390575 RepID=UPI003D021FB8